MHLRQRKDAGSRKEEWPPERPQSKPLPAQSAAGHAHQKSDSTATNRHARAEDEMNVSVESRNDAFNSCRCAQDIFVTSIIV